MIEIRSDFIWDRQAITSILSIVGAKDPSLVNHSCRVAQLAVLIAKDLQLPENVIDRIRLAALAHDIGKICIEPKLLYKPGTLTKVEMDMIRRHATYGYLLLQRLNLPWRLAEIVYQHHERQDGTGYPRGLSGDSIMPEARIIAVADFVEALTHAHPYRKAFDIDKAIYETDNFYAKKFDTGVMDACIRIICQRFFLEGIWGITQVDEI